MSKPSDPTETAVADAAAPADATPDVPKPARPARPTKNPDPVPMPPQVQTASLPDYVKAGLKPEHWQASDDFLERVARLIGEAAAGREDSDRLAAPLRKNPRAYAHTFVMAILRGESAGSLVPGISAADLRPLVDAAWDAVAAEVFPNG